MTYPGITNTSILAAAGIARFQYAGVNSIGVPLGRTGSLSVGQDAGLSIVKAVKAFGMGAVQNQRVFSTGDNGRTKYGWSFNSTEIGELALNFAVMDMNLMALGQGISVKEHGDISVIGLQTDAPANLGQVCLLGNIDAQDADTYNGNARWLNMLIPLTNVFPNFGEHAEATPMDFPFVGQPTQTARVPWGETIASWAVGYDNAVAFYLTSTNYPLTMHTFVRNASTTTFTLDYKPYGDHTNEQTLHVWDVTAAGVATKLTPTTDYTINISTNTVTLGAAGTSGTSVVVLYEAMDILG